MNRRGALHIGTSGWHYDHWKGPFYPAEMASREFLGYYAGRFMTAEINSSFYRMPEEKTLRGWAAAVPAGFVFAVKASRYITHMKKLKDPAEPVSRFMKRCGALGGTLGPVLFQLPPRWGYDAERLRGFLDALPRGGRYAMEFRDPSWWNGEAYGLLKKRGVAFCVFHLAGETSPREVTARFVYIRLHGPGGAYEGSYSDGDLRGWASEMRAWSGQGRDVFCYFDNDEAGYAARDAMRLKEMAGG
ncbi:MAG: DUF72 domain-containing protein [Thermodesulfovibrionales bacterium]